MSTTSDTTAAPTAIDPPTRTSAASAVDASARTVATTKLREAAEEFLAQPRIAVVGVSRDTSQPANLIYRRLRDAGHEVFAINANTSEVEGDLAYPSVSAVAGDVDGAVIVTPPEQAITVIEDCAASGVRRVWLHRGLGPGSSSPVAIERAHELGLQVIPGGCPNMFGDTSDLAHRCMCTALTATHKIPRMIGYDCSALEA
jgi:uncharacterized protein